MNFGKIKFETNKFNSSNLTPIEKMPEDIMYFFGIQSIDEFPKKYRNDLYWARYEWMPSLFYYKFPYCKSFLMKDGRIFGTEETVENTIDTIIELTDELFEKENYKVWMNSLPHGICFEFINQLILDTSKPTEKMIDAFVQVYSTEDYNFELIQEKTLEKIKANLPEKYKTLLKSLPFDDEGYLTIYRGIGGLSNSDGYSWTLDPNVAYSFACFYDMRNASVLTGKVKKEDIVMYLPDIRNEDEVLVLPSKIEIIDKEYQYNPDEIYEEIVDSEYWEILKDEYLGYTHEISYSLQRDDEGRKHATRTMLYSSILSYLKNIDIDIFRDILTACLFHDVAHRGENEDSTHGKEAVEKMHGECGLDIDIPWYLDAVVEYHCKGKEKFEEWLKNSGMKDWMKQDVQLIFDVLSDADELDKVRFPHHIFNIENLHFPESRRLVAFANGAVDSIE